MTLKVTIKRIVKVFFCKKKNILKDRFKCDFGCADRIRIRNPSILLGVGPCQHEDPVDAAAAHREDDLQRVHLLQHAGARRLPTRQDNQSGGEAIN